MRRHSPRRGDPGRAKRCGGAVAPDRDLAWLWLQNQPTSALSLWFYVRRLGGRMRKTSIVTLARKLLIALWRYTTAGVVIEGAVMKAALATI
jgi:hypothetical protein